MYKILVLSLVLVAPNYTVSMRRAPMPQRARPNPLCLIRAHYSTPSKPILAHEEKVKNMHAAIKASAKSDVGRSIFIKNLQQIIAEERKKNSSIYASFIIFTPLEERATNDNDLKKLNSMNIILTQANLKYFEELQNGTK